MPINDETKYCLNCDQPNQGDFCSHCGQSVHLNRITFRETFNDFLSSTFALQGPLFHTIWMLLRNPGKMLREFLKGKRRSYYTPVSFFVLTTVIYLLVRNLINYDPLANQSFESPENHQEGVKQIKLAARWMVTNINNVMLLLVFTIGIVQKALFPKRYNLAEYLSVGFYISGIYTLGGLILMLVIRYILPIPNQFQLVFLMIYTTYVVYSLHEKITFINLLKYIFTALLSIILYVTLGFGLSFLIVVYWH